MRIKPRLSRQNRPLLSLPPSPPLRQSLMFRLLRKAVKPLPRLSLKPAPSLLVSQSRSLPLRLPV
nr:MAG TPA: hypothetical protein [Bacteriophage sp.]